MTWRAQLHHNYEEIMARDPFGAEDGFRFWLHDRSVILGTLIAVGLRISVWRWFKQAATALDWLSCWRDREHSQQLEASTERYNMWSSDYFRSNGWERACESLTIDPEGWRVQVFALARLVFVHLLQPLTYVAISFTYSPVLWQISPHLGVIDFLVLLREAIYAGFSLWTFVKYRAFMLFSLKHADEVDQLYYIISPDKLMVSGISAQHGGWRGDCLDATWLFLFGLDMASGLGLAIGLEAQVLEPPVVVAWGLTAMPGVYAVAWAFFFCVSFPVAMAAEEDRTRRRRERRDRRERRERRHGYHGV